MPVELPSALLPLVAGLDKPARRFRHYVAWGGRGSAKAQLGRMLKETLKNEGVRMAGRDSFGGAKVEPPKNTPTLADLGLDKKTSSIAQKPAPLRALSHVERC